MGKTPETKSSAVENPSREDPAEVTGDEFVHPRLSILAQLLLFFIRIYQHTLSHLIGNACRHQPTCSNYGLQAIQKYGAFKGGWLTTKRVIRCHPWGTSGYDPVE